MVCPRSDVSSQSTRRRGHIGCCRLICITLLAFSLFLIGVAVGLLIGKLVFDKDDDKNGGQISSTNWGGMVTQDGVQKPVLEAIVDMMKTENIKENLRYVCARVCVLCVCARALGMGDIDILAYNYCEASISRLSRLLNLLYSY